MKSLQQWFDEYAESHQNETNQVIHFICVPLIFLSLVGLLMSIPAGFISNLTLLNNPIIENWATPVILITLIFYAQLSLKTFFRMFVFSLISLIINYNISIILPLFFVSLFLFVMAWIGQFYGHKIEGKKPSFFKDLQFLLIGPVWVIEKLIKKS